MAGSSILLLLVGGTFVFQLTRNWTGHIQTPSRYSAVECTLVFILESQQLVRRSRSSPQHTSRSDRALLVLSNDRGSLTSISYCRQSKLHPCRKTGVIVGCGNQSIHIYQKKTTPAHSLYTLFFLPQLMALPHTHTHFIRTRPVIHMSRQTVTRQIQRHPVIGPFYSSH